MDLHQLNAIPMWVVYIGAACTMVALLVASYQNKWSCRVFFMLALRLAIGWHFLFEGLHKLHSHEIGATETNRVFTSEPYFAVADGPLGPLMRKQFGDMDENLKNKLDPQNLPEPFAKRSPDERMRRDLENKPMFLNTGKDEDFAKYVPKTVESEWNAFRDEFAKRYNLSEEEQRRINGVLEDNERKEIEERDKLFDQLTVLSQKDSGLASREFELKNPPAGHVFPKSAEELKQIGDERKKFAAERIKLMDEIAKMEEAGVGDYTVDALARYGKWAAGVEGRTSKMKYVSSDVELSAPQRLEYITVRQKEFDQLKKRTEAELGVGYGLEQNRLKDMKALIMQAKSVLLADADAFVMELKKSVFTGMMALRLNKSAPTPSKLLADHPEMFFSFLPESAESVDSQFDKLPKGIQQTWATYHKAFREYYPDARKEIDHAFDLAKDRTANWYANRDEFIGKNLKLEAARKLVAERKAPVDNANANQVSPAELAKLKASLADAEKSVEKLSKEKSKYVAAADRYGITTGKLPDAKKQSTESLQAWLQYAFLAGANQEAKDTIVSELDTRYASLKQILSNTLPADVADWPPPTKADKGKGPTLDLVTMWMIIAVGAMLLAGLFTRIACLVGAIFLLMTYLTHPPFPWLPLPPNTEGNPLFINKNIIEMLALLVIMVYPTGRWMGIDALLHKIVFWKADEPK